MHQCMQPVLSYKKDRLLFHKEDNQQSSPGPVLIQINALSYTSLSHFQYGKSDLHLHLNRHRVLLRRVLFRYAYFVCVARFSNIQFPQSPKQYSLCFPPFLKIKTATFAHNTTVLITKSNTVISAHLSGCLYKLLLLYVIICFFNPNGNLLFCNLAFVKFKFINKANKKAERMILNQGGFSHSFRFLLYLNCVSLQFTSFMRHCM